MKHKTARPHPGFGVDPLTAYNAAAARDGAQTAAVMKPGAPRALAAFLALLSDEDIRMHIECADWPESAVEEFGWLLDWVKSNR